MARWFSKRWVWAALAGATVTIGTIGMAAGRGDGDGPPKVGAVIPLNIDGKGERQFKVVKSEKQPDGTYLSELKDTKTGETITLVDKPGDTPPAPPAKAPEAPKGKPRPTDPPAMPNTAAMPDAGKDKEKRPILGRLFGDRDKDKDKAMPAMPGTAASGPVEPEKRPGLIGRVFGPKKPPAPSMPALPTATATPSVGPVAKPSASAPPAVLPLPPGGLTGTTPAPAAPVTSGKPLPPFPSTTSSGSAPSAPTAAPDVPKAMPTAKPAPPVASAPTTAKPPAPLPTFPESGPMPATPTTKPAPAPAPLPMPTPPVTSAPPVATPAPVPAPIPTPPPLPVPMPTPALPAPAVVPSAPVPTPALPTPVPIPAVPVAPGGGAYPPIPVPPGGTSMTRPIQVVVPAGYVPAGLAFDREVQPFVIALQSMSAPSARLTAAQGLAEGRHCSTEGVKSVLFQAARMDPCGEVRAACITHLCKLGYFSPHFLGYIQVACDDADPMVRDAAKDACTKMIRK